MGPENTNPLEELKLLEGRIDRTGDLAGLKPIFARLDELARQHPADLDVQLAVSESKQRVLARGTLLKQAPPERPIPVVAIPAWREAAPVSPAPRIPPPQAPPPQAPPTRSSWTSAMVLGGIAGAILAIGVLVFFVNQARRHNRGAGVAVQVATTPQGAAIRVNGEQKCASNCDLSLVPGDYQLMAFLDGYEPAVSLLTVTPGKPAAVNLELQPQAQSVRILTDLPQGQVTLDDQPPVDLQDGQYVLNKVPPGTHAIKVASRTGEAAFTVEVADAKAPTVNGPVTARNLIAVLVSSIGEKARVATNNPAKLALNGQPQADAGPAGVDLTGFRPGVNEIVVGEGKDQRTLAESFGPAPALTVFLKSDLNIGTLIISTGEDEARVFLNGKEYPRKTQRGQVRIPTIGNITVRAAKEGFELAPPQVADVKKGSEVRLEFKMQPLPRVAALEIKNATPGAEVLLDQKPAGTVAPDGTFTGNGIAPGDHTIELRRENYVAKRMQRQFVAGRTVELAGADVVLAAAVGSVRLTRTPADTAVVYRRADETQSHELRANQMDLPPGNYVFTGRAAGYTEKTERVAVTASGTHTVELALVRVVAAAPPPPPAPKIAGVGDFEDPNAWSKQGDLWTHKGGGFIPFKLAANGIFTFTIRLLRGGSLFRGGRIRWVMQYTDAKNYDLFEMDRRNLYSKVIINGKVFDRGKYEHGLNDREMSYTLQLEASPEKLIHSIKTGGQWLVLDTWQEPGRNFTEGKFAFLVQGNDEIGLADFKFVPR
ncbi:MAG: PEGA domain-containing protein [Bryobacterales bacterium]|nr:PEGA domain-containing protein [Bryobacterales bacterium]